MVDEDSNKMIERSINRDITKIKRRLVKRVSRAGLWENFGQREFRDLSDKYGYYLTDRKIDTEPIFDFQEWCMNYDGRDKKVYIG